MRCYAWSVYIGKPWLWTKGSLYDVATHAGRCSSIMRHFITERQPLASIESERGLREWGTTAVGFFYGKNNLVLLLASLNLLFLWKYKLSARSKWTWVSSKLRCSKLRPAQSLSWRIKFGNALFAGILFTHRLRREVSPQQKVCGYDMIWSLKLTFTHVYADRSTGVDSSYLHFVSILQSQKVRNINTTEQQDKMTH